MEKILFIAPKFYSYHVLIKETFEEKGFIVDYFDDRPDESFFTKALLRLNKSFLFYKRKKYFLKILQQAKQKQYEIVFIIYGQSFTKKMMEELRLNLPNSKFIFYMFDPLFSMPDRLDFSMVFDKRFSFDINDVKKHKEFQLLPLFYKKDLFHNYLHKDTKQDIDVCYIGTMMPGKYSFVNGMLNELKKKYSNIFNYQFIQSKLVALFFMLTSKDFKHARLNEFKFDRIDNKDALEIMSRSKFIIDCPKKNQSGLTIRIFEALILKKKIITTNDSIKDYDFYDPRNIYIYDGKSIDFTNVFFTEEYYELPKEIIEKYEISNWVDRILGGE